MSEKDKPDPLFKTSDTNWTVAPSSSEVVVTMYGVSEPIGTPVYTTPSPAEPLVPVPGTTRIFPLPDPSPLQIVRELLDLLKEEKEEKKNLQRRIDDLEELVEILEEALAEEEE